MKHNPSANNKDMNRHSLPQSLMASREIAVRLGLALGLLVVRSAIAETHEAAHFVGGVHIAAAELAFARAPHDGGIAVFGDDGAGLAAGAVAELLSVAERQAGDDDGGVVLLRAVDAIGELSGESASVFWAL